MMSYEAFSHHILNLLNLVKTTPNNQYTYPDFWNLSNGLSLVIMEMYE